MHVSFDSLKIYLMIIHILNKSSCFLRLKTRSSKKLTKFFISKWYEKIGQLQLEG